jgi:hypothetical protein
MTLSQDTTGALHEILKQFSRAPVPEQLRRLAAPERHEVQAVSPKCLLAQCADELTLERIWQKRSRPAFQRLRQPVA